MATKSTATHPLWECYEQRKKDLLFPGYSHPRLSLLKTSHQGTFPGILQHEFPSLHMASPARTSSSSFLHELPKASISFHWNHAGQTSCSLFNHNQLFPKMMHSHMAGLFPKLSSLGISAHLFSRPSEAANLHHLIQVPFESMHTFSKDYDSFSDFPLLCDSRTPRSP